MSALEAQLRIKKAELEMEIVKLETSIRPLNSRLSELRSQLAAVQVLLPGSRDNEQSAEPDASPIPQGTDNNGLRKFTPVEFFWVPILETLVELGGRGRYEHVVEMVGQRMQHILTPADKEILPSGVYIRWKNRVAWQRFNMVKRGFLRNDSPRGVWEITDHGRSWLLAAKKITTSTETAHDQLH